MSYEKIVKANDSIKKIMNNLISLAEPNEQTVLVEITKRDLKLLLEDCNYKDGKVLTDAQLDDLVERVFDLKLRSVDLIKTIMFANR